MLWVLERRFLIFCGTVLLSRLLQTVRSAEASRCPPRIFCILFRL